MGSFNGFLTWIISGTARPVDFLAASGREHPMTNGPLRNALNGGTASRRRLCQLPLSLPRAALSPPLERLRRDLQTLAMIKVSDPITPILTPPPHPQPFFTSNPNSHFVILPHIQCSSPKPPIGSHSIPPSPNQLPTSSQSIQTDKAASTQPRKLSKKRLRTAQSNPQHCRLHSHRKTHWKSGNPLAAPYRTCADLLGFPGEN